MIRIHGWGNFPSIDSEVFFPKSLTASSDLIKNINNLIPLLQQIVAKILSYIPLAQPNSTGYKIKG